MLFDLPSTILYEISLYLNAKDILHNWACTSQQTNNLFNNEHFKIFWIKGHLSITLDIDLYSLIKAYLDIKMNTIVNFKPWLTNGGISAKEYRNSYSNMWKYNPDVYSTYYEEGEDLKLNRNVCCTAYFNGKIQRQDFAEGFYIDVYKLIFCPETIREMYKVENLDYNKVLMLDPLSYENITNYENFDLRLERGASMLTFIPKYVIKNTPIIPQNVIPIVKKMAIARPLFYTGCVKSLIIIFSEDSYTNQYEEFDKFNDIMDIDMAKHLGNTIKIEENDDFEWVEYDRSNKKYYPVLWMQFKTWKANHLVITLTKCHYPTFACVKLLDIDDRRLDCGLQKMQPNYDITYTLMLGSIVDKE